MKKILIFSLMNFLFFTNLFARQIVETPVAAFTADDTSGTTPLTVQFTDQSINDPTSWLWDFGDDSTSIIQNPSHTYTDTGTYTVKLKVTNSAGSDSLTKTNYITVDSAVTPVASFTAGDTSGTAPLTVQFTDSSSNNPTSWLWDFGDDSTSIIQNPSHTYTSAGTYTVKLIAFNSAGNDSLTKTDYITVSAPTPSDISVINFKRLKVDGAEVSGGRPRIDEGQTYTLAGLKKPLNILNGTKLEFPEGSVPDDTITITIKLPGFVKVADDTVSAFRDSIISSIEFIVTVDDDTISPYNFSTPINVTIPYKRGLMEKYGFSAEDLGLFFFDTTGTGEGVFDTSGISSSAVESANNRISGQVSHFSNLSVTSTTSGATIVPVELSSFSAIVVSDKINLMWTTLSETNNLGFHIERSPDEENFVPIAFVEGHGTSAISYNYQYIDDEVNSDKYYYRLKQIDFNGSYEYSDVVKVVFGVPGKFYLSQNYPNPFNPETEIKYQLPEASSVNIKVYNIMGQEIKTLFSDHQSAGYYSIKWDGTNNMGMKVASGIYVYRLQAGSFTDIKKMVFLQ